MFSQRGFDGVSVKEIAKAVGIKDSSLYNHYKSKLEIFNTILREVSQILKEANNTYAIPLTVNAGDKYKNIPIQELTKMYVDAFKFYLADETASKFRKLLIAEQHMNQSVGNLYNELFFDLPMKYLTILFTDLVNQGTFIKMDPYIIAMHFYSSINFLIRRCDIRPDLVEENISLLEQHIEQFDQIYRVERTK